MAIDDHQLLLGTHRGEEPAARELWSRFAPRMLAYARTILGRHSSDAAEDVVQGVFLSILRLSARRIRAVEDVPSWMLRLTRNAAANHLRSARRERARMVEVATLQRGAEIHNGSLDADETSSGRVMAAIEALPRRHREPLVLRHIAGLTFDQLGLAMGINRNTAASRYRAALTLLRKTLGKVPGAEPAGENHA